MATVQFSLPCDDAENVNNANDSTVEVVSTLEVKNNNNNTKDKKRNLADAPHSPRACVDITQEQPIEDSTQSHQVDDENTSKVARMDESEARPQPMCETGTTIINDADKDQSPAVDAPAQETIVILSQTSEGETSVEPGSAQAANE